MERIKIKILFIFLLVCFFVPHLCPAQEGAEKIDLLKQNIRKAKAIEEVQPQLEELSDIYFSEKKFGELYDFLATLEKDKKFSTSPVIYYYEAKVRYNQIQFLEENKLWEDLFNNKDLYESQINTDLEKAQKLIYKTNDLSLRIKLLEWQLLKDNSDASLNKLEELFNLAQEYAKGDGDVKVIKEIADTLSKKEEINYAKKLYSVYISKISQTDIGQQELKKLAEDFLKDDKVDLAISLFDAYLDKLISTQKDKNAVIAEMFEVAGCFAHTGWQEGLDPFYSEKIYQKIEDLYGGEAFPDLSQYARAYNLERSKEHKPCLNEYLKLVDKHPDYKDKDRIYFRLGVITAYHIKDIEKAKEYFLKVTKDYPASLDYLGSLYQLGLLSQAQDDSEKAMKYYLRIQEATKDMTPKPELAQMTDTRINEIIEEKAINYNLKMFLDTVLKSEEEKKYIHLDLYAKRAKEYLNESVKYQTNSYYLETGCLQQDFTYLWSGELGSNQNPFNKSEFETSYDKTNTKVVNVVLVSPTGSVDGTVEMADIYER